MLGGMFKKLVALSVKLFATTFTWIFQADTPVFCANWQHYLVAARPKRTTIEMYHAIKGRAWHNCSGFVWGLFRVHCNPSLHCLACCLPRAQEGQCIPPRQCCHLDSLSGAAASATVPPPALNVSNVFGRLSVRSAGLIRCC